MTSSTKTIAPPSNLLERFQAAFLRGFLRVSFRTLIGPPLGIGFQRLWVEVLAVLMPGVRGTQKTQKLVGGCLVEIVTPRLLKHRGAILCLHGGAFCLGNSRTHRAITTRLAVYASMQVWVPNYRLAPEHPYPAALNDALACYQDMLKSGYSASQIVVAGDSAGGALTIALAMRLRTMRESQPAALLLMSPVTDGTLSGPTLRTHLQLDPMIRRGWLEQGIHWYAAADAVEHQPLQNNLSGLPPMLIQVGDRELLLSDSTRLAEHASQCGVPCQLEIYAQRWHVFQLQAFFLQSSRAALKALARFAQEKSR